MVATLEVTGLQEVVARLKGLQGAELKRKSDLFLAKAVRGVVVPAVKAEAPTGKGRPTGPYPHPSGYLKRRVSARKLRTRPGESVAYGVRARVFYAPMVIGGTKPHLITPKGVFKSGLGSRMARSANRGGRVLAFGGTLAAFVHHPGAKPNRFIARAASRIGTANLAARLGKELMK